MALADVLRVGAVGLRTRPLRAVLSALGIAIGIAAMIAVVGISSSTRAELDRTLDALGTNLLTVAPGTTFFGEDGHAAAGGGGDDRPDRTGARPSRRPAGRRTRRSIAPTRSRPAQTGGIAAVRGPAATCSPPRAPGCAAAPGSTRRPAATRRSVLGADAAERLGITRPGPTSR